MSNISYSNVRSRQFNVDYNKYVDNYNRIIGRCRVWFNRGSTTKL